MKLTKETLAQIIREELENFNEMKMENPNPVGQMSICDELVSKGVTLPEGSFEYASVSDEQLVLAMCQANHYKPFYFIAIELSNRGYTGPKPTQSENSAFRKKMKSGVA